MVPAAHRARLGRAGAGERATFVWVGPDDDDKPDALREAEEDIRGCREIGTDGEHLLLVPPRDAEALTSAVRRLVSDASLRERLGAAARERALASFDQRRIAATSLATYGEVARRRGLAIPMAVVAWLVRRNLGSPVLFTQERPGAARQGVHAGSSEGGRAARRSWWS